MERKTILHFIFNLGRGGAETMLVTVVNQLQEYNNIVVTLQEKNDFEKELKCDKLICLNKPSLLSLPASVFRLKNIIRTYKVSLVHSHLPLCNFIARLAVPAGTPLISTIHNSIAHSKDYKWAYLRWLDKLTFKFRTSTIIAVSKAVEEDYFSTLKLRKGKAVLLYNFVDEKKYTDIEKVDTSENIFKIVSVGSLSFQKNFIYLVKAFQLLKQKKIELHIYGQGQYYESLKNLIEETKVNVVLKGQVKNIHELLPFYDLFVMPSLFEGFSLSVLEAMAAKLPLLLSDTPSFREQAGDSALYFDLEDPHSFVNTLLDLKQNPKKLKALIKLGNKRVLENFTLEKHMQQLKQIYLAEF